VTLREDDLAPMVDGASLPSPDFGAIPTGVPPAALDRDEFGEDGRGVFLWRSPIARDFGAGSLRGCPVPAAGSFLGGGERFPNATWAGGGGHVVWHPRFVHQMDCTGAPSVLQYTLSYPAIQLSMQ
jgi:hypothetical protein